ncbi:MAG TPA: pyridoxal phosphate-dependent aminotransferase family protein [Patescibacteria group bacterium]|nr:pyridoxal phosphate-dependent aminotransferase family protein [Patescibacteria group bacterium]
MNTEDKMIEANEKENRRALIRQMFKRMKQYNVSALEIKGRQIRVGDTHWVTDFASCNYLGFDLDPAIHVNVDDEIEKWGVHPSWCRLVASPQIYTDLEDRLARLVGTEATLILPTVTLISIGIIPALVGKTGVMFLDKSGHETMYEGCKIARDSGATLKSFRQGDFDTLEKLLAEHKDNPRKMILVDGVYSMTGDYADIKTLQSLAKKYDAILYIDDAHGFGVVGESPDENLPFGYKGNGIVKYAGCDYENIIYVGGCSKAYSSLAAFVACSRKMKTFLQAFATPYDLSGPCPTASLATLWKGLDVNEQRGDQYRKKLWELTHRGISGLRQLGFTVVNQSGFPIVSVKIGDTEKLIETANFMFDYGVMATICPYPMVTKGEEVHRLTFTAANSDEDVTRLLDTFAQIKARL